MQRRKLLGFAVIGVAAAAITTKLASGRQGATQIVLGRADGPFVLDKGPIQIPLKAVPSRAGAKARSLAALLDRVQAEEHVLLVLRGLHAAQPPNIVVQVHLGLPEGEKPVADDPHYAGTLNFFNVVRPPGAEGVRGPDQLDSFDVTDVIQNLRATKRLIDPVILSLTPVGAAADGSNPSISRIDLVVQ
jgi:hypothetical protein